MSEKEISIDELTDRVNNISTYIDEELDFIRAEMGRKKHPATFKSPAKFKSGVAEKTGSKTYKEVDSSNPIEPVVSPMFAKSN